MCSICNREFKKKSHYDYHILNKKNPCHNKENNLLLKAIETSHSSEKSGDLIDILIKNPESNTNNCFCIYCEKVFARTDSLQRHLNGRCKSKENYDELEKLKEDMKLIIDNYQKLENNYQKIENNYQKMENENVNLKKEIDDIKITQLKGTDVNESKIINNNVNNQINKGVIVNNIQLVQFGSEDIDKINLIDAMKSYLKSTGGNIVSNMLTYINLNKDYPENNNICMTDMSREIVKIHNGKKFVYKKFKNVKEEILNKIVKNTRKIVTNYILDGTLKKSNDINAKLKINDVSLKIIDGVSAEDIVREEINEKERCLNKHKDIDEEDYESEEEREFTLEERLRIEHLEKKREGMQKKTFENIKDELYNARELIDRH